MNGNIYLVGHGDPTLGSWRYNNTKEQIVLAKWINAVKEAGIQRVSGDIVCYNKDFGSQTIPGGWVWDDIGNYYGAGVSAVNWRENQYDLLLKSGNKEGDPVSVVSTIPKIYNVSLTNELTTGKPGTGDNAYIYLPPYASKGFIRGTIPPNQSSFTVSGSFPDPPFQVGAVFKDALKKEGIDFNSVAGGNSNNQRLPVLKKISIQMSPSLDSINYWFLKKSINLYGEALVKILGYEKEKEGSTETGINIIKSFWKSKGIEESSINIMDGSGLSPQNRVTAQALVKVMDYANQSHFLVLFSMLYR